MDLDGVNQKINIFRLDINIKYQKKIPGLDFWEIFDLVECTMDNRGCSVIRN